MVGRSAVLSAKSPTTATVRLVDGTYMTIPISAGIEVMVEMLASGRPLGEVAGESIEFWAQVEPDDEHGSLINDLIRRCRRIVERRQLAS